MSLSRRPRRFRAVVGLIACVALLAGCGHTFTPNIEARPVPLLSMERAPLRVAILMSDEDRDRVHTLSTVAGLNPIELKLTLGRTLQDTLGLSLASAFERLTVVRSLPASGVYHLVLAPKVADAKYDVWSGLGWADVKFDLTAALRVLDQAGAELATLTNDEHTSARVFMGQDFQAASGQIVTQAISNVVRKWGDEMLRTSRVAEYVTRLAPTLASAPTPRPVASEVSIVFSHPAEGARVAEDAITPVGVASAPKGIQRIELVVNGRAVPVSRDVRAQSGDVQSHPFTAAVPLRGGENVIALTAIDTTGAAHQAVRTVGREVPQPSGSTAAQVGAGERWAVVVGIDRYQDPSITTLRYAAADADAVFKFLTTKGGVKPANARLLVNQQATQRNLRQVLGDFLRQKVLKDDEVIIYYAGHGTTEADASAEGGVAKYLVPWDADPNSLFSTAIPMEEIDRIFGRMSARKILLVQDTCFSGGAGGRTFLAKGLTVRATSLTDRFLQDLSQKEGRMILTASDVNQVSHEDPALGHGIFTRFLLQALESGAADLDGDGAVTVRELHLYLQRRVHEYSRGAQTPQLYNVGDMVLVRKPK